MQTTTGTQMALGELLRYHREHPIYMEPAQDKFTQKELADLLGGYHDSVISRMERGENIPKSDYIERFIEVLNLPPDKASELRAVHQRELGLPLTSSFHRREDWGTAPDVSIFYGRQSELADLEQWVVTDRCRLIAVLGMGGMGKTTLVTKLAQQIKDEFAYVLWCSLLNAPPMSEFLSNALKFLSDQQLIEISDDPGQQIAALINLLREQRCLLVFDNAESILQPGGRAGYYREGYEAYGQLLQQVGRSAHQSCLLLTSREAPKELTPLASSTAPVRALNLIGLAQSDSRHLLQDRHLVGDETAWELLTQLYAGNPLALQQVSANIQDLFGGDIKTFLKEITNTVFGDIRFLLDQQFDRLSELERDIMFWLAINRESTTLPELKEDSVRPVNLGELIEALESLRRRSLVEKAGVGFSLQNVITEYLTDRLVQQVCEEVMTQQLDLINSHALLKATAKTYVRETQERLILKPMAERLVTIYSQQELQERLKNLLDAIRTKSPYKSGYLGGNIINLLRYWGWDISGFNFSHLAIWQAYLQGVHLQDVNFASATLAKSVLTEAFGSIFSVVFNPDGKLIAAGTANGEIRLWQVADGQTFLICRGHTDWVRSVAFSPDGHSLVSAGNDETIRLWDVNTGQCFKTLQGHNGRVKSVVFSPDGHSLVSAGNDETIRLWDVNTGQCFKTLQGHTSPIYSVAFSPESGMLATGGEDRVVRLWDVNTGQCRNSLLGHSAEVLSVAFSSKNIVASGSADQTIRLWNANDGQCFHILQGHSSWVRSVTFSYDGFTLVSSSDDGELRLWRISTGECLRAWNGHFGLIRSVDLDPKGHILVTGGDDQAVCLWNADTGQCLKKLQGHSNEIRSVAFSSDGYTLASGGDDRIVRIWNTRTEKCITTLKGHTKRIWSIAFSPNRDILASASEDQTIRLWNVNTGQHIKTLEGHTGWVEPVAFCPSNSNILASGSDDRTIRLWEVNSGQFFRVLRGHTRQVWSIAFSPNRDILASASEDQTVRLWNVKTGRHIKTLEGHTNWVLSVAFGPTGRILASGGRDQIIKLWDLNTGKNIKTLQGHADSVWSIVFNSDGETLVSASYDQSIKLWNLNTGECLKTLHGHSHRIWSIAFSPTDSTLASGSGDQTIKLWNVKTGECLKTLHPDRPYERMNITGVTGISESQKASLKVLGAIEDTAT
jgi:WD40 repeat protein/transcriptional regulator with XRE-family HTH domain